MVDEVEVGATVVDVMDVEVVVDDVPPEFGVPGRTVVTVLDVNGTTVVGAADELGEVDGTEVVVGAAVVVVEEVVDDDVVVVEVVVVEVVVVVGASVVDVVVVVVVVVVGDVAGTDVGVTLPVHGNGVPQLNAVEFTFVTVRPIELESVNNPDESVASKRSFVPATGVMGPDGVNAEV